jgi:hypothetical protein
MAFSTHIQPTSAPTPASPSVACYLCGGVAHLTLKHRVFDRQYGYVWCITCSFGQYQHVGN